MKRLVTTSRLDPAPILSVTIEQIYDDRGRLLQPTSGRSDFDRACAKMAKHIKPKSLATYRPYMGAYWRLCEANAVELTDARLLRGFIGAVIAHAHKKPSASTLRVVMASLVSLLTTLGYPSPMQDPATKTWFAGELKSNASHQVSRKRALLTEDVAMVLDHLDAAAAGGGSAALRALRDRAIILLGWTCALRRSELVRVHLHHLAPGRGRHWSLTIPDSKTSAGKDHVIPVGRATDTRYDAITTVQRWVRTSGITGTSPLFRKISATGHLGNKPLHPSVIKSILMRYGLEPEFGAHSLRAGFVTQARTNGATNSQVKAVSRHRSDEMIDLYDRPNYLHLVKPPTLA